MNFYFSFYVQIISYALIVNGSEKTKCDYCHSIVFSDGKIESHDESEDSGSKCFNGSQEIEVHGDGRDGQCKTVYVVDWLTNTRNQVDLKRIWTHEIGVSFPTEKVCSLGAIWKNCNEDDCSQYYQDFPDNFINEAKQIIENGFENSSKSTDLIEQETKTTECFTCVAYSIDPNDSSIRDCYSGKGNGEWETCDEGQVCLTYFYFNNMVPNGIDMTYQAMTSCQEPQMVDFKQYQEHHYCNTDNCNKQVMLGDGVQPNGDDDDQSDGVILNMTTRGLTFFMVLSLI